MASRGFVQTTLSSFGATYGIGALQLDDHGRVGVRAGSLEFVLQYDAETVDAVWIVSVLGVLSDDEGPGGILTAGLVTWLADALTVSVEPGTERVCAFASIPTEMLSVEALARQITRFTAAALHLKACLEARSYAGLHALYDGAAAATPDDRASWA